VKDKKEIVKNLDKILDMLPKNLSDDENNKVEEIKNLLRNIEHKIDSEG